MTYTLVLFCIHIQSSLKKKGIASKIKRNMTILIMTPPIYKWNNQKGLNFEHS